MRRNGLKNIASECRWHAAVQDGEPRIFKTASNLLRYTLVMVTGFLLDACMHQPIRPHAPTFHPPQRYVPPPSPNHDSGPLIAPDVSKIPEPIPKTESLAKYGNKSPYTVLGQDYRVLPRTAGYVERGIASWYGNKFHGQFTSTREPYDMYLFTAAHKTLPIPCYARVTNLENGSSIIVRVNDRGPFVDNRIMDLSLVAAVKLGIWQKGTGLVEVRAIDPLHLRQEPARTPTALARLHTPKIYLQIGAFATRANAARAVSTIERAQLGDVRIVHSDANGHSIDRVRIGPLADVEAADRITSQVRALGLGEPHVALDD